MTCFSNDVPTTETRPRTESVRTSFAEGVGADVAGVPGFVDEAAGGDWLAALTGAVPPVSGDGPTDGMAGGPPTTAESRAAALSSFADPPAHAADPRPITINTFLITFSSRAAPSTPRHSAEPRTSCQLDAGD
jgi:hypothetical protein